MATCPDCGHYLSGHHHCRGRWRRRLSMGGVGLGGALVGAALPFVFIPGYQGHLGTVAMTMVLGAVLTVAVWQAIP